MSWVVRKSVKEDNDAWLWYYWAEPEPWTTILAEAKHFQSKEEAESVLVGLRIEGRHLMVECHRLRGSLRTRVRRCRVPYKKVRAEEKRLEAEKENPWSGF